MDLTKLPAHIAEQLKSQIEAHTHHHPTIEPEQQTIHVEVQPPPATVSSIAINLPSTAPPAAAKAVEGAPLSTATVGLAAAAPAATVKETLGEEIKADAKKILTVMETVAKDAEKALVVIVKYAPSAASLAAVFFPADQAALSGVVNAVDLIQNTVLKVKQQAAALPAGLTNEQMLADELAMVGPAVTSLLASEGIAADNTLITNIINGVVAILKVRTVAGS